MQLFIVRSVLFIVFVSLFCGRLQAGETTPTSATPSSVELQRTFGEHDVAIFRKPSQIYRPETWFHFIGGNVAKAGITADLEAIAAAGISGVQLFHGQFGGPWPGVEPQIPCLSEDWDDAVKHVAMECKRLGLRFTMQNCPGWAMSGGPWIEPENAMRHLVWSRTDFQHEKDVVANISLQKPQPSGEDWRDYRDIAVLAFPTPVDDTNMPLRPKAITTNREGLPWEKCFAGSAEGKLKLPPTTEENPCRIDIEFSEPVTIRTVEFSSINRFLHAYCYSPGVNIKFEVFDEPENSKTLLRPIFQLDLPQASWQDDRPISLACDETTAKRFRISIVNKHEMTLDSLRLFSGVRKNNWESEAGWTLRSIVREGENPKQNPLCFIDPEKIFDISDKMNSDGNLSWTVPFDGPSGAWTVLRIGHVNTGMRNGPAPPEGTGWECDKLSVRGPDVHFAGYVGRLVEGPLDGGLLNGILLDSWECKTQTWTPDLENVFERKAGYPLRKFLPAVFGYVVKDHETSKRFLRDWRGTIGDLFSNVFYGRMAEHAKNNGLAIQYETAAGDIFPADIMEYFKHADVPMCEFWHPMSEGFVGSLNFKPIKPTASAARLYGKPRVSAEAFTSFQLSWDEHWEMLKEVFNVNAVEGVTHCVFHTYTHNPRTDFLPPGTAFGSGIGTPFLRGQTWWKHMPEFTDYLARCCFLLERGRPVSDVLWYLGDEIDHKPDQLFPFPEGFKYDYCNTDVLLNRLSVQDGKPITPEGILYNVLWMPDNKRMLPETLEKLLELVRDGVTVVGNPPEGLATLSGGGDAQKRFDHAVKEIWGETPRYQDRQVGKGRVLAATDIADAFKRLRMSPDVIFKANRKTNDAVDACDKGPMWLHRKTDNADWYFICAPPNAEFNGDVFFRSGTKIAEIWDPVTGKMETKNVETTVYADDSTMKLALELPRGASCFVVFHKDNGLADKTAEKFEAGSEITFDKSWTLEFPDGWGTPKSLEIERLKPWKDLDGLSEEGKAFSGTVKYTTTFGVGKLDKDRRFRLDLGKVDFIAAVSINGKKVETLWALPYELDVTEYVNVGENILTIDVTSTWFNRLVHDAGLPENERKTWTIAAPSKDSPLRESGLLGPVRLFVAP